MNKPFVSIIICSRNGASRITNTLRSLASQTWPKNKYEVIVVDDGSTDNTSEVASQHKVTIIKNPENKGLAQSRNEGILKAKGEIIAFTDDDCIPTPSWIENLVKEYTSPGIYGVGGRAVPYKTNTLLFKYIKERNPLCPLDISLMKSKNLFYRLYLYIKNSFIPFDENTHTRQVYALVGANMSFRAKALHEIGLFDSMFRFGAEEEDLCDRLYKKYPDKKLIYTAQSTVLHDYDISFKKTLNRSKSYGIGNARMYIKHKDRNPTIFPFPLVILASISLVILDIRYILITIALPLILYPAWTIKTIKTRKTETLTFPYIQSLCELYTNYGFCIGWLRYRKSFPKGASADGK